MSGTISAILLWLFVINLGITFGAGLYEHRIVMPRWLPSPPESGIHWDAEAARRDDTGRRFWASVTTMPLTLLTIANLVGALRASGDVRSWWLATTLIVLVDRAFTFSYFIPKMVRLMRAPDTAESVAVALRWRNLNYLRHAIVLAGWLAALRTFALFYQRG